LIPCNDRSALESPVEEEADLTTTLLDLYPRLLREALEGLDGEV
jgi:hypothetical protein